MKKSLLAVLILAMGLLVACGKDDTSAVVDVSSEPITVVEDPLEKPEESASTDLVLLKGTERKEVNGKMQSYLTGEWKDAEIVQRRNLAVMIPNNSPALPHYGISLASIIYEAPAEKESCTRLLAVFEDYDELDYIGPVRSARDYYMYEAMAFDSIFVNWGLAVPYAGPLFDEGRIDHISEAVSGQSDAYSNAFTRRNRSGYAQEFTGYLQVDKVDDAIKHFGYETEYTDRFVQAFTFADAEAGSRAEYADSEDALKIYPGGKGENAEGGYQENDCYFKYDEKDQLYYRYQHGGALTDEYNDEHVAVSNVVIKICYGEWRDDHGYLAFGIHGEGDAYVFTNGKVIKATWQRWSDYEPNIYLDEDGNEIVLNQGKTWVCNVMDKYVDNIEWE